MHAKQSGRNNSEAKSRNLPKGIRKAGGVKPEECLICEDNQNGIQAALASGAHLFKVDTVNDVTYANIKRRIEEIEKGGKG